MNRLKIEKQVQVVACLVEGVSMSATSRMTGVHCTTIQNLLVSLGTTCSAYQDKIFRNLPCKRIQCDEIWSFIGSKEKNTCPEKKKQGWGDVWTWTALDPDTKLVPAWYVGTRGNDAAYHFIHDLKGRLANRVQLTTDGHQAYRGAIEDAFGADIDFGQLVKIYDVGGGRYLGSKKVVINGNPASHHISTSLTERQNLTMRMSMRRFTRRTNAFSKKFEHHEASVALHFMHYNFARVHQTLRVTPAMQAGLADHVWSLEEIVRLVD